MTAMISIYKTIEVISFPSFFNFRNVLNEFSQIKKSFPVDQLKGKHKEFNYAYDVMVVIKKIQDNKC